MGVVTPRRIILQTAAAVLLTHALPGCDKRKGPGGGKGKGKGGRGGGRGGRGGGEKEPLVVELVSLERHELVEYYEGSGTLQAVRRAQLRPQRAGVVVSLEVEEGDVVEEGQLLAKLDGRELNLMAKRDKVAAKNAKEQLERLNAIPDAVSEEERDLQRFEVQSAKASAALSRYQARQMKVEAPFNGTIVVRPVDEGNLATTTTIIYEIADLSALEVELFIPERDAAAIQTGAAVELAAVDGSRFQAKVARRAPIVDALTGTVKFTVQADNPPEAAMPGGFVRAFIELRRKPDAQSLPQSAVIDLDGEDVVFVHADGVVHKRVVESGMRGDQFVEVVSGLGVEDQAVREASTNFTEGMPVRVQNRDQPKQPQADASEPTPETKTPTQG